MNSQYVRFNQRMVDTSVTEPSHQRQNCVPLKASWTYKEPSSSLPVFVFFSDVAASRWYLSRNGSSLLWGFLFQLEGSEIFIFLIVTCLNEPCRRLGSKQAHCEKQAKPWALTFIAIRRTRKTKVPSLLFLWPSLFCPDFPLCKVTLPWPWTSRSLLLLQPFCRTSYKQMFPASLFLQT